MGPNPPYPVLIQTEKVLRKVLAAGQWAPRRKIRIAILSNATTSFLASALLASGFREGVAFEICQCPFGQYPQDILDPASGLSEAPFRRHEDMLLKLDDFVCFAANWQDKARNIAAIAEDLSLGLDSLLFLDDAPAERALVRAQLPQVRVPECGSTPQEMLRVLRRGMFFECLRLTAEDRQRHRSYRASAERKSMERTVSPWMSS